MDRSFQKEILERRNTILFKKEIKNIDPKHTIKPIKHKRHISDPDYLIIASDNNDNIIQTLNHPIEQNTHNNLQKNIDLFNQMHKPLENTPGRYSNIDNQKKITIDLNDNNDNNDNTITKKNLFCFSALIVACYISITILNDYILIKYLNCV